MENTTTEIAAMELATLPKIWQMFVMIYITCCTAIGVGYLIAVTFVHIPIENRRHADTISGFMMGTFITSCLAAVVGTKLMSKSPMKAAPPTIIPPDSGIDIEIHTPPKNCPTCGQDIPEPHSLFEDKKPPESLRDDPNLNKV